MAITDLLSQMHADVHGELKVAARYAVSPFTTWSDVNVRVHERTVQLGALGDGIAAIADVSDEIVFDMGEVTPTRGAVVSISETVAYRVGAVTPRQRGYASVPVVKLQAAEALAYFEAAS